MAVEEFLYVEIDPMPNVSSALGSGESIPVIIDITTPGTTLLSAHGIPAGKDIQLELWGGGAGGSSDDGSLHGGGGGGGGGYLCIGIEAALVAADGNLVVGAAGAGGASPDNNGADGTDSTITLDAVLRGTAGKGIKGTFAAGVGGAGGTNTVGAGVTEIANRPGNAGGTRDDDVPGAGGTAGVGGAGGGGAGGDGAGEDGADGTAGRARISYSIV